MSLQPDVDAVNRRHEVSRPPEPVIETPSFSFEEASRRRDACLEVADDLLFSLRKQLERETRKRTPRIKKIRDEIRRAELELQGLEAKLAGTGRAKRGPKIPSLVPKMIIAVAPQTIARRIGAKREELLHLEESLDAEMEPIRSVEADIGLVEEERRAITRLFYSRIHVPNAPSRR
ncbi:MAG: hypothetical protein V1745_01945 [Patescibacteria group bacterium]